MRSILTALAVLLTAAPAAQAETYVAYGHSATGDPTVTAGIIQGWAGADRVVELRSCPPDGSACTPLPESAYSSIRDDRIAAVPGETAAGTTFEAAFEVAGAPMTRRTAIWMGRPRSATPASVSNALVGQRAQVTPGTWSGGWTDSADVTGPRFIGHYLFVCRDPSGTDCFTVGWHTQRSERLTQRWAGWYLFVKESFDTGVRDPTAPIPVIAAPRRVPDLGALTPWTSRSAPVQICCVLPAPAAVVPKSAALPTASIPVRARRSRDGRLRVARVRCAVRCAVRLTVIGGGRTVVRALTVRGPRSLAVPGRRGVYRVRVVVDGKQLASGRSRAR